MQSIDKINGTGLFFIRFSVVDSIGVFIKPEYQSALLESILFCQKHKGLLIFDYCIMPGFVELVTFCYQGNLSGILRDLKSYSSKRLIIAIEESSDEPRKQWLFSHFEKHGRVKGRNQTLQFWEHGSYAFQLYSRLLVAKKIGYIQNNPVRAGFVSDPAHWLLSGANPCGPIIKDELSEYLDRLFPIIGR
jgi:hypothetical protein